MLWQHTLASQASLSDQLRTQKLRTRHEIQYLEEFTSHIQRKRYDGVLVNGPSQQVGYCGVHVELHNQLLLNKSAKCTAD